MANHLRIANGLTLDFTLASGGANDAFLAVNSAGSPVAYQSIAVNRLVPQTPSRAAAYDASGYLTASPVTSTELGYVSGVTSSIQTQLDSKQGVVTLTANRLVVTDGSGHLTVVATTDTEAGYVSGVTSAIQTQLNGKQATITGGASSIVSSNLTVNRALVSDGSGKVIVSAVTATELGYVSGVTSAIQAQIDGKLTVTVTSPSTGDVITYNGSVWVNSATAAVGVPVGGTAGQYLNKIDGTNYNTQWSTLVLSAITDVTASAAEVNVLDGVTTSTSQLNYLNTSTSDIQAQLNTKLGKSLSQNAIWVGNSSNVAVELAPTSSGYVLTLVGSVPTWQPSAGGGGGIAGPGSSTDNAIVRWDGTGGTTVQDSLVTISDAGIFAGGTWQGNKVGLAYGGTNADLSATGGAGKYLKQASAGAAITVVSITAAEITSGAALTKVDDTNVTLTLGGTPASALLVASSLTLGWTGTLAYARFVNGAGLSVVGRSTNSSGVQADITAGTDAHVLRRSGTSIGFGTIGDASITALAWSKITGTPTTIAGYGITDASSKYWGLNPQGSSYTFVLTDADSKLVQATSASATNFTIPPNASVAYPIGSELPLVWDGTGQPSFVAGAGVTINSSSGDLTVPSRYSVAVAVKVATNTWYLWNGSSFSPQSARTFLAGPTTGGAATPSFRTMVSTDIIAADSAGVLTNNGSGVLSWAASGGTGTVTSVSGSSAAGVTVTITGTPTVNPTVNVALGALTGVTSLNGLVVTANTGVITTGTWNGSVVAGQYGGTGVANTGKTITIGGNLTFSGAFATTISVSGTTSVVLPTSGTLMANPFTTTGDIMYSSGSTPTRLAAVATGSVLGSAGTATAPAYLAVGNGLTATATTLGLGGALSSNTIITGGASNYSITFGDVGFGSNDLTNFSVRLNGAITMGYTSGASIVLNGGVVALFHSANLTLDTSSGGNVSSSTNNFQVTAITQSIFSTGFFQATTTAGDSISAGAGDITLFSTNTLTLTGTVITFDDGALPTTVGYVWTASTVDGQGNWAAPSGGGSSLSGLTVATGTNTINNGNFAQTWQWNTLAGTSAFALSSSSTAAASNAQVLFTLTLAGANSNSTQTTYSSYIQNLHTGTASTNIGQYIEVSGGTNNYALQIGAGNIKLSSGTTVMDNSGNELLRFVSTASAVNDISIANASTGFPPYLISSGDDTNIGLSVTAKGTGLVLISTLGGVQIGGWNVSSGTGPDNSLVGNPISSTATSGGGVRVTGGNCNTSSAATSGTVTLSSGQGLGTNSSSGNIYMDLGAKTGIGTVGNIGLFTTSYSTWRGGEKVLYMGVCTTAPNATGPTGGIFLWAETITATVELRVQDSAGNKTTLSPHNWSIIGKPSEEMAWSYFSERRVNDRTKRINVDMLAVIREVEKLVGRKLVYQDELPL